MPLVNLFTSKKITKEATMPNEQATQPTIEELVSQLANQTQATDKLTADLVELQARAEKAESELKTFKEAATHNARKAQLSAVMDVDAVDTMLSSTSALDDTAFAHIVAAMSSKVAKQEEQFKEVGEKAPTEQPKDAQAEMLSLASQKLKGNK